MPRVTAVWTARRRSLASARQLARVEQAGGGQRTNAWFQSFSRSRCSCSMDRFSPWAANANHAQELRQTLAFLLAFEIQKGHGLRQRVAQHCVQAVTGADQAGDGAVPRLRISGASLSAERWMPGTTRPTKKSAFT
jgi:hypothetical protein